MHSDIQQHVVVLMISRLLGRCHSAGSAPATQQACAHINLTHSTLCCALMSKLSTFASLSQTCEQTRHYCHQPVVSVGLHAIMGRGMLPLKVAEARLHTAAVHEKCCLCMLTTSAPNDACGTYMHANRHNICRQDMTLKHLYMSAVEESCVL